MEAPYFVAEFKIFMSPALSLVGILLTQFLDQIAAPSHYENYYNFRVNTLGHRNLNYPMVSPAAGFIAATGASSDLLQSRWSLFQLSTPDKLFGLVKSMCRSLSRYRHF